MKLKNVTTWQNVFEGWRTREASDPGWIECATKVKGWPDWKSWRSFTARQIGAENREWRIFEFSDPMEEIPQMLVGPYSGWQSRVRNKNNTTFTELLDIPGQFEYFSSHGRILSIIKNLPFATEFIGIIREDLDKVVCLEGHHRATAIALVKKLGEHVDFTECPVTIALTYLRAENCRLLDEVLQRGTTKNPGKS
jgi:hypothetical protein